MNLTTHQIRHLEEIRLRLIEEEDSVFAGPDDEEEIRVWVATLDLILRSARVNDEAIHSINADCRICYAILDELDSQLAEDWSELHPATEKGLESIERLVRASRAIIKVRTLIRELVDPLGPPTEDDPASY